MSVRIAHLSDIHFGARFDLSIWAAVKAAVIDSAPDLLIVSGDMVDSPVPVQLLAAKCELRALATRAAAKLVVVPGNHDVYAGGVQAPLRRRKRWFERVFFNDDTSEAERLAEHEYGAPLGFSEAYRHPRRRSFGPVGNLRYNTRLIRSFENALPHAARQDVVKPVDMDHVLIATLDSNKPGQRISLATGWVDDGELVELGTKLKGMGGAHLARIAVVHHHVLPIAVSAKPGFEGEPLMVLHNAGTVLAVLAEHHFDLILHGHWHVAQFARLDLSPADAIGYPMAVVSAGSAALRPEAQPGGNAFNLVTITANGRIAVETQFYGGAYGPNSEARGARTRAVYREPVATVKLRARIRARERHRLECGERAQMFEVTETGDLIVGDRLKRLTIRDANHPRRRDHALLLPRDGWFVRSRLSLVALYSTPGCRIEVNCDQPLDARAVSRVSFRTHLPADRDLVDYGVSYACANSVNMTSWEGGERERDEMGRLSDGWDKEWVSGSVSHPTDELSLTLKLPPALSAVVPWLECWRAPSYPAYAVDDCGDAQLGSGASWVEDGEMAAEEADAMRYDPMEAIWKLKIRQPIVGYLYRIVWTLPGDAPVRPVQADVLHQQRSLLHAADTGAWPPSILSTFNETADVIGKLLGQNGSGEKRNVGLFIYDSRAVALRPVLSRRSWTDVPLRADFLIPLGRGIAGAAFQQRRIIAWTKMDSPFIVSFPYREEGEEPADPPRTLLALPIYHPSYVNEKQPPPWACLGVLSFGSTSEASLIPRLLTPGSDPKADSDAQAARAFAHAIVDGILKALDGRLGDLPPPRGNGR